MTQRLYLHNREHLPKSLVIDYLTEFPDIEGVINQGPLNEVGCICRCISKRLIKVIALALKEIITERCNDVDWNNRSLQGCLPEIILQRMDELNLTSSVGNGCIKGPSKWEKCGERSMDHVSAAVIREKTDGISLDEISFVRLFIENVIDNSSWAKEYRSFYAMQHS